MFFQVLLEQPRPWLQELYLTIGEEDISHQSFGSRLENSSIDAGWQIFPGMIT